MRKKYKTQIKSMAILGILFFATALVAGVSVNGLLIGKNINEISYKILENEQVIGQLESSLITLKENNGKGKGASHNIVDILSNLVEQIDRLKEENKDFEKQIEKIENNVQKIYAIFPISPY